MFVHEIKIILKFEDIGFCRAEKSELIDDIKTKRNFVYCFFPLFFVSETYARCNRELMKIFKFKLEFNYERSMIPN